MHLFCLFLLATRYLYDVCSSIIVICDLNFFRSNGPLVRLFVDDCAYPSSRLALAKCETAKHMCARIVYRFRSRSLGDQRRFSTSHNLINEHGFIERNVEFNPVLTNWPISTIYPLYLVTESLRVRRPEAYGAKLHLPLTVPRRVYHAIVTLSTGHGSKGEDIG